MPIPLGVLAQAGAGGVQPFVPISNAYVHLSTIAADQTASVSFSNLNSTYGSTYKHLELRLNTANRNGLKTVSIQFNGDTTSGNYADIALLGTGIGATSTSFGFPYAYIPGANVTANTFGNLSFYIPDYAGSTQKSASVDAIQEDNIAGARQIVQASKWANTAAITRVTIKPNNASNFAQYSTATLYGISKVPSGGITTKATGGDIYQNGAYTYHVFKASGTFTPTVAIPNAEMLVVAGGAGGGGNFGGGGGAGGVISFTGQSLPASAHTVTVGAGGGASTNGVNSQFAALTAAVAGGTGGDGRGAQNVTANSGGSGGGGGGGNTAGYTGTGGAGTSGQGYAGGNGIYNRIGGGGGGAGGAGATASGSTAGMGGAATSLYSVWTNATSVGVSGVIAGGGGGASLNGYGSANVGGGGGAGNGTSNSSPGGNATANTGSGGGAGSGNSYGGNGGSGIVIIRYA